MALSFGACAYSCSEGVCLSQAENVSKSSVRRKRRQSFGKDVKVTQGSSRQRKIRLFFLRFLFWLKFQINYNRSLCDVFWNHEQLAAEPFQSVSVLQTLLQIIFRYSSQIFLHLSAAFATAKVVCKDKKEHQDIMETGKLHATPESQHGTWTWTHSTIKFVLEIIALRLRWLRVHWAVYCNSNTKLLENRALLTPKCEHCRSSISTHWIAALATCHRKWKIWFHHV